MYRTWRPTPLVRAYEWEKALDTPARIYYKYEGGSPSGSHKPNTAVAQAYYNKEVGVTRLATETGAGQWGSALSFACQVFGIECKVYMVRVSYEQKPYRKVLMQTWGKEVVPSPSPDTNAGRRILARQPGQHRQPRYCHIGGGGRCRHARRYEIFTWLGANHVLLHQTVIGQEVISGLEAFGEDWPDVLVGCTGGGSNFAGFVFPILKENISGGRNARVVAVEPAAAPSLTRGVYTYDFGDTAQTTPLIKMHTLGHDFVPAPIHAGGLRYHGMSAQVSALNAAGLIEAVNVQQRAIFEAARSFTGTEGILPAPEPAHVIWGAMQEALACKESGERKVIVFNMCGHGHFDLAAYEQHLADNLEDFDYPEEAIRASLQRVPSL